MKYYTEFDENIMPNLISAITDCNIRYATPTAE